MENQIDYDAFVPKTIVAGVGGAGANLVNRLCVQGIKSADTVAINTDVNHLNMIKAHKKVLIGKQLTRGLGAGGFAEVAAKCALADRAEIERSIQGYDLVFICAGMGGGTGTGAAPVVAQVASDMGATVIAAVTFPFALERSRKLGAEAGIAELSKYADSVMVIENDLLLSYCPNLPMEKALEVVDNVTGSAVKNIADAITIPSLINLDYADLKSIVTNTGTALISIGTGAGPDKVEQVIKSTLAHPLMTADIEGAKGALIHVSGGTNVSIDDATRIGEGVTQGMANNANVIFGARVDPSANDYISVMSVITGVKAKFGARKVDQSRASLKMEGLEYV